MCKVVFCLLNLLFLFYLLFAIASSNREVPNKHIYIYNIDFWSRTNSNTFICNPEFHAYHEAIMDVDEPF